MLAQSDPAGVRAYRNAEFCSHQDDCQHFIDPAQPATVDLAEGHRPCLHELLVLDGIADALAAGHPDRRHCFGNRGVPEDVVGVCRFFDPTWFERCDMLHVFAGLLDTPDLVRIDHEYAVRADFFADEGGPPDFLIAIDTDLHFEAGPAGSHVGAHQITNLIITVPQPPRAGGVGRQAATGKLFSAGSARCRVITEDGKCVVRWQRVADIAELDTVDQRFRRHVGEQLPQRLVFFPGIQIPNRVDQSTDAEVQDALFRAEPAELSVVGQLEPEAAHVRDDILEGATHNDVLHHLDHRSADFIAASERECDAVSSQAGDVSLDRHVWA